MSVWFLTTQNTDPGWLSATLTVMGLGVINPEILSV
jgi:hypothetical protein